MNINKVTTIKAPNSIILATILLIFFSYNALAEIVNPQKDEKKFGDWKVFCETDTMMNSTHCKIGAKFFDNASSISIEPNLKSFNQLLIVIPKIRNGDFVQMRIDKNDLILSQITKENSFGLIAIEAAQKNILFEQMKKGDFLFFRFNISGYSEEITAKINLRDFQKALDYSTKN